MQKLKESPALRLRAQLRALGLPGMLRWDTSGMALLVLDAPRHMGEDAVRPRIAGLKGRFHIADGLLYADLAPAEYKALLAWDDAAIRPGRWKPDWLFEQSILAGILSRHEKKEGEACPNEPLLRRALIDCARGEAQARAGIMALPCADADALRTRKTLSVRACAALYAQWLRHVQGAGLPRVAVIMSNSQITAS